MRSLISALLRRRCVRFTTQQCRRSLSSHSKHALVDDPNNVVLVEGKASSRTAVLNRPSVLNALNTSTGVRLTELYKSWEDDPNIGFVALKGSGRAFSAGGDVVAIYNLIKEGKLEGCKEFFRTLYSFIYLLGTYLKPHDLELVWHTVGAKATKEKAERHINGEV
ncbi:hypothetical protein RJ639_042219 [Escallonia herrerae]|uniref:3-hydroxyisobutyryl-CoA hydrolase n=1 Tax=Escallonia herrerae TaxID=1293975 RepID=A0AA88WIG9_9ASTE|nr:hypothetical protein RJ639_042219 [Escallonia herrerae]